jgi:hypothetical protein
LWFPADPSSTGPPFPVVSAPLNSSTPHWPSKHSHASGFSPPSPASFETVAESVSLQIQQFMVTFEILNIFIHFSMSLSIPSF